MDRCLGIGSILRLGTSDVYLAISCFVATFALGAIVHAFQVITPRPRPNKGKSIICFKDIARRRRKAWLEEIRSVTPNSLRDDMARQILRTADIALRKYIYVRRSIIYGGLFLFTSVLAYVLTFF